MKMMKILATAICFLVFITINAQNTFYGDDAGENGTNNSNFGAAAGKYLSSGLNNVHVGYQSGFYNESGRDNTVLGYQTGYSLTSGTGNVLLGKNAGYNLNDGNNNTLLGSYSGYTMEGQAGNVFIGYQAGYSETGSNKLYISNSSTNTLIYGDFANTWVGIGKTDPAKTLDVAGDINFDGNIYKGGNLFKQGVWGTIGSNIYYNNGYVGIGFSTNPQSAFHILGTDYNSSMITIQRNNASGYGGALKFLSNMPGSSDITIGNISFCGLDGFAEYTGANIKAISVASVVSPSYKTNLEFNTSNDANLETRMVITGDGNVGIGTDTPVDNLDIVGKTAFKYDATNYLEIEPTATDGINFNIAYPLCTSPLHTYFNISKDQSWFLKKVGIGTDTPEGMLDVKGIATFRYDDSNYLKIETNAAGEISFSRPGGTNDYIFFKSISSTQQWIRSKLAVGGANHFSPKAELDVLTNFCVSHDNNNYFEIDPAANGVVNFYHSGSSISKTMVYQVTPSSDIHINNKLGVGVNNPQDYDSFARNLVVGDPGDDNNGITVAANIRSSIFFADGTGTPDDQIGRITYSHDANSLNFYTNNANQMVITSTGFVGIGTPSPSEKLYVNGNAVIAGNAVIDGKIDCEELEVLNISLPDYVFSKDYNLRSLKEVNDFIEQNKHLPGVPSAKEVEDNGMNVVEMTNALLEKIEELTLYTIQQQKAIDVQNEKIETLMKSNADLLEIIETLK